MTCSNSNSNNNYNIGLILPSVALVVLVVVTVAASGATITQGFTLYENNENQFVAHAQKNKMILSDSIDVPKWVANVALWLKEDKISKQEFSNMISYLAQKKIIPKDYHQNNGDSLANLTGSSVMGPLDFKKPASFDATPNPEYKIKTTDGTRHVIPLDALVSGGPPKDGIPSIDNPKFVDAKNADFLSNDGIVIGVSYNGEAKAYPLSVLVWHEIVNDKIGELPISVTYCPLCYSSQVFVRIVQGEQVEFGVSGKLYNSNLVMYDRKTDTKWSEMLGVGIVGELSGYELKRMPFDRMAWKDWKSLYPETRVLSKDTGHPRPYGSDPYGDYYTSNQVIFSVQNKDDRLHPKKVILGLEGQNGTYKAYKKEDIQKNNVVNDKLDGKAVLLVSSPDHPSTAGVFERPTVQILKQQGKTSDSGKKTLEFELKENSLVDTNTGSVWNYKGEAIDGPLKGERMQRIGHEPAFWFSWVAFHPDTKLYSADAIRD